MNVSKFIVKYMKARGVNHFFGYQGTMITYFVDAIGNEEGVYNHSLYNEQGASLAACGFAKSSGKMSCAYSTSGPGTVNLVQGIADAYYDSIPVLFITGQLNKYEYTTIRSLRQQGFQEINIIEITRTITKYNELIDAADKIVKVLPMAISAALSGRRGPVLIDIPMDIQKTEIRMSDDELLDIINNPPETLAIEGVSCNSCDVAKEIIKGIEESNRPIFLVGNGIHRDGITRKLLNDVISKYGIPVLSSLMAKDMVSEETGLYFGFIGSSYGQRSANIIANKKTDLIIALGCRLSTRLTGVKQSLFAKGAKIYRIEIDNNEIQRKIHDNEIVYISDVNDVLSELLNCQSKKTFSDWVSVCKEIKKITDSFDDTCCTRYPNKYIQKISKVMDKPLIAVADVGQNMMWVANSFSLNNGQELIFSGGHGAMGFALPAAIGAYYASKKDILCFSGDGGFQMNIQELQYVFREKIPIRIFVLNNNSLGMITQVQDDYLDGRRTGTDPSSGFSSPDFSAIANAYGIRSFSTDNLDDFEKILVDIMQITEEPILVQILFMGKTFSHPKTYFGEEISNQRPYLPKDVYDRIMKL